MCLNENRSEQLACRFQLERCRSYTTREELVLFAVGEVLDRVTVVHKSPDQIAEGILLSDNSVQSIVRT